MIQVLDQHTIDKIAAGEVVERPASIVKELVENAIDSGANAVTIEIKEGGISFIRITDNGCGIPAQEVQTAFLRHATSKITSIEDLLTTASLGFRGEALSSIAAVAQVEVITKTSDALTGIRYEIHGGIEQGREEIGCPEGTTFIVRNLFYNTPARRKFLKTAMTEGGYINELVEQLAMSRPDISFKFVNNGQNKINTSGNGNLKDIIYHVYGRDISGNLLPIATEREEMQINGFVAKPYVSRGNRSFEHYFVNGRYIKSPIITRAIEEAYKTFVMVHKFPFVVLNLELDPKLLDVNVHPRKMEMRYSRSEELYKFIFEEIRAVLLQKELIPEVSRPAGRTEQKKVGIIPQAPEPFEVKRKAQIKLEAEEPTPPEIHKPVVVCEPNSYNNDIMSTKEPVPFQRTDPEKVSQSMKSPEEQISLFQSDFLSEEARPRHRLIGQLFRTYWLIEYENSLFIMDQHAAHEKVMYEKLMKQYQNREILSQQVEPPLVISVNPRQIEVLQEHQQFFSDMGFQMESFGGKEYMLRSVPLETYGLAARDIFIDFIDSLIEEGTHLNMDLFIYKIATMACKAAVKGNMSLSIPEADALIDQLLQLENPYNCPHGRPTIISMTETEIEKKFKRIQDR